MIQTNIGRKASRYKGNGMIMNTTGRRESLGSGKDHLMFRKDGLEVLLAPRVSLLLVWHGVGQ
jgi:hypothetical protein